MTKNIMPAVKALIEEEGKVLALKVRVGEEDMWTLPGGRVEYGEAPKEALKREVREEVSLEPEIGEPVGMYYFFIGSGDQGDEVVLTVFETEGTLGSPDLSSNPADEPIQGYEWKSPSDLVEENIEPSMEKMLRKHYKL